jgi:hypothetical protein
MGVTPLMLAVTSLLIVRNQRILQAWNVRQEETNAAPPPGSPENQAPPQDPHRARRHY